MGTRQRTGRVQVLRRRIAASTRIGVLIAAAAGLVAAGCAQNELGRYSGYQPSQWSVKDPKRVRSPIVKSETYWIQKDVQPEEQFPGPTPTDLRVPDADYILGPGDLIDITVFELMAPGQPYVSRQRISQTGQITFPYIGTVKCTGLTTRGLEEKMGDMLEPDYLVDPQVSVFVTEYRNLSVSVLNGVYRPGIYAMTKQSMTLLELVAQAGGMLQLVEDYGYVIREYSPDEADLLRLEGGAEPKEGEAPAAAKTGEKAAPKAGEKAVTQPAAKAPEKAVPAAPAAKSGGAAEPAAKPNPAPGPAPKPAAESSTKEVRDLLEKMAEGDMPAVKKIEAAEAAKGPSPAPARPADAVASPAKSPAAGVAPAADDKVGVTLAKDQEELGRWIWSDGKWVEVKGEKPPAATTTVARPKEGVKPPEGTKPVEPTKVATAPKETPTVVDETRLALEQKLRRLGVVQGSGQLKRIIRFDVRALLAGDPTQNVVLRDSDIITVPSPPVGDFYMAGEVARPGVYSLTGRKITLLQAVAAAGGLTAVAVPWRTELVRRISEAEEEIIYVDLAKISRGDAPDFYLQPEDQIRVGTDQGAIFNAVLRNAFRATYGIGGVYDMNFADFYPWTNRARPIFEQIF